MKLRDLKLALRNLGWWFLREGGNHEVWTNGTRTVAVPRHTEVPEGTARRILKDASRP
jgi:mRNA interferase HicA